MATESERPIEKLLRAYAKRRREDAGAPFELKPEARRQLAREAKLQQSAGLAGWKAWLLGPRTPTEGQGSFLAVLARLRPGFAVGMTVAIVLLLAALLIPVIRRGHESLMAGNTRTSEALSGDRLGKESEVPAPTGSGASGQQAEPKAFFRNEQPAKDSVASRNATQERRSDAMDLERLQAATAQAPTGDLKGKLTSSGTPKPSAPPAPVVAPPVSLAEVMRDSGAVNGAKSLQMPAATLGSVNASGALLAEGSNGTRSMAEASSALTKSRQLEMTPPAPPAVADKFGPQFDNSLTTQGVLSTHDAYDMVATQQLARASGDAPAMALASKFAATGSSLPRPALDSSGGGGFGGRSAAAAQPGPGQMEMAQRFVRLTENINAPLDGTTLKSAADNPSAVSVSTPVLASFDLQQSGQEVRIVDKDGSLYTGQVQSSGVLAYSNLAAESSAVAEQLAVAPQNQPSVDKKAPVGFSFLVSGTNRSLNQLVIITGNLIAATDSDSRAVAPAPMRAAGGRGGRGGRGGGGGGRAGGGMGGGGMGGMGGAGGAPAIPAEVPAPAAPKPSSAAWQISGKLAVGGGQEMPFTAASSQ